MRWLAVCLSLAAFGCGSSDRSPFWDGNGGGGQGGSGADGGGSDGATSPTAVTGKVCETLDLRSPTVCLSRPSGLNVSLDGESAATDDNGTFELTVDPQSNPADVRVDSNGTYRASLRRFDAGDLADGVVELEIPVVDDAVMSALESSLGEGPSDNTATIAVYLTREDLPLAGALLTELPAGTIGAAYYDIDAAPGFDLVASTGDSGVILIFGVPALDQEVALSIKEDAAAAPTEITAPTSAGAISFVSYDFPPL